MVLGAYVNVKGMTHWPPSAFAQFGFVYDHNGSFDTLHGHRAHSLSLVCHRSEQIASTRDSVCRSFYVVLFA